MLNTLCTISCPLLYFFCKFRWYRSVARGVLKISQTIDRLVAYRIESYICIEFIEQKNLTEPLLQNAHCSNCTLYYIHPRTCMILRYDELPRLDQLYPYCGSIFFQPFANTIVLLGFWITNILSPYRVGSSAYNKSNIIYYRICNTPGMFTTGLTKII